MLRTIKYMLRELNFYGKYPSSIVKFGSKLAEINDIRNLANFCPPLEYVPSGSPALGTFPSHIAAVKAKFDGVAPPRERIVLEPRWAGWGTGRPV